MNKIFIGPEGNVKKNTIYREVRQRLCIGDKSDDCRCRSCIFNLKYHPDFMEISSGKKEQVDEALLFCMEIPSVSGTKVILISEAEGLTVNAANALLKSVEEGPGVFLFSSKRPLIDTINSRCATKIISSLTEDTDTYGLTPSAFEHATDKETALIDNFKESGFFSTLREMCNLCTRIKEKREWLSFFHLVKEKDGEEFYSAHSKEEVMATLKLMSGIFFSLALGNGHVLSDYSSINKLYSRKDALCICKEINKFLLFFEKGKCSKNDFFVLVTKLIC